MAEIHEPLEARDARLTAECLRVYRRYAAEIVEGLGLCPWAARSRKDGHVREIVLLDRAPSPERVLEAVSAIADDLDVEIGLLIFPRIALERLDFERFVSNVRNDDEARARPKRPLLAMAAFHPSANADLRSPARLTPFVRSTPDPTIQLVRCTVLERVRQDEVHGSQFVDPATLEGLTRTQLLAMHEATVPLHERIARANHATVEALGVESVRAKIVDIQRDRDRSYVGLEAAQFIGAGG